MAIIFRDTEAGDARNAAPGAVERGVPGSERVSLRLWDLFLNALVTWCIAAPCIYMLIA